ncbi:MAG: hypothetical protein JXL67_12705 [Calditrichaeota bacterium]|nr:hypothetical protein [Calditrichota bacterium]
MSIFDKNGKLLIPFPERLKRLGAEKNVVVEKRKILVKLLYCTNGHMLIREENPKFDDQPGIHLICEGDTFWQSVYLSPYQGDSRKKFNKDFNKNEILRVYCPECNAEFPKYAPHDCRTGAMYIALFLDAKADINNSVCICNVWGCPSNFLRLSGEVYSEVRGKFPIR